MGNKLFEIQIDEKSDNLWIDIYSEIERYAYIDLLSEADTNNWRNIYEWLWSPKNWVWPEFKKWLLRLDIAPPDIKVPQEWEKNLKRKYMEWKRKVFNINNKKEQQEIISQLNKLEEYFPFKILPNLLIDWLFLKDLNINEHVTLKQPTIDVEKEINNTKNQLKLSEESKLIKNIDDRYECTNENIVLYPFLVPKDFKWTYYWDFEELIEIKATRNKNDIVRLQNMSFQQCISYSKEIFWEALIVNRELFKEEIKIEGSNNLRERRVIIKEQILNDTIWLDIKMLNKDYFKDCLYIENE